MPARQGEPGGSETGGAGKGRWLAALAAVLIGAILYVRLALWYGSSRQPGEAPPPSPAPTAEDAPPAVETTPAVLAVVVSSSPPPPTPPTGEQLRRRQALELLEPLIRPIAQEADGLDLRFRYYLEACRSDFRGAPQMAGRYWFFVWTSRADIEWGDDAAPAGDLDCRGTWIELVERARSVGTALEALEETAVARGVLPEYVDKLLAAHRLNGWREAFRRPRTNPRDRR